MILEFLPILFLFLIFIFTSGAIAQLLMSLIYLTKPEYLKTVKSDIFIGCCIGLLGSIIMLTFGSQLSSLIF